MAKTPFDQENMDFSLRARKRAVETVYPKAFGAGGPVDTTGSGADMDKGYDLIWLCEDGTTVSIQERFRREKYSEYRELTATKHNHASDSTGDFFKLDADYYAYGYFSSTRQSEDDFSEILIVNVDKLKHGDVEPDEQWYGRKSQAFFCWPFESLIERGYHVYHARR